MQDLNSNRVDRTPATSQAESQAQALSRTDELEGTPGWIVFGLVTSSYFVVLAGLLTYCVLLPL